MNIQKFIKICGIMALLSSVTWASQSLTLVLLGNKSDSNSIRITKDFSTTENNIGFQICDSADICRTIGEHSNYHECQIKELVKVPAWAVFLEGGEAFAKAAGSWASFAKILVAVNNYEFVQKQLAQRNPIRVTDYLSKEQAEKVTVLSESEKTQQALTKVDNFNCK